MKIGEWVVLKDGAYRVLELIEHPVKKNVYAITIHVVGYVKNYWRREVKASYELSRNDIYSFKIESVLNEKEILEKSFSYLKLIKEDKDKEVREISGFNKRIESKYVCNSSSDIKKNLGMAEDFKLPEEPAY